MSSDPGKVAAGTSLHATVSATQTARRWQTARIALWTLVLSLAACSAWQFRALRVVDWVDVPIHARAIQIPAVEPHVGEVVRGDAASGLPDWHLAWDGQWPLALLCNVHTGEVLGPSLLRADALDNNSRGVRWSRDGCQWVVDRATWNELGQAGMVLRCQRLAWRLPWLCFASATLVAALLAIFCGQRRRVLLAAPAERRGVVIAEWRRSLFILLSLLAAMAFVPGIGFNCPGDVANINSFAASLDSPHVFEHDALLGDPRNFAWYTPLYVKLVRMFGAVGLHYDTSRVLIALVATSAGLFGYFRLFRTVSRSAGFALAATLGLWFFSGDYPSKESWGPELILPRTLFAALLPWALLAGLRFQRRSRQWSVPAALGALLFYVHPVSAPALIGAQLTGFVASGRRWTLARIGWGVVAALAAIAVMFPYTLVYAGKYAGTIADDELVLRESLEIARRSFGAGILSPTDVGRDILTFVRAQYRYWPVLAGLVWLVVCRRRVRAVRMLLAMTLGYAIVTLVLPTVDLMIAARRNQLPFQVDLFRNIRYLDVWLLLVASVIVREASRIWQRVDATALTSRVQVWNGWLRPATIGVLLVFAGYSWSASQSLWGLTKSAKSGFSVLRGHSSNEIEARRALVDLRKSHEVVSGPIALRQWNVPLAFTPKDRGALIYSNPQRLLAWQQAMDRCEPLLRAPIGSADVGSMADVLGADLVLLPRKSADPELLRDARCVFCNPSWILLRRERPSTADELSVADGSDHRPNPR